MTQLIGRETEVRQLKAALAEPDAGLVVVSGPSGVGKTALVDAVLEELAQGGAVIGCGKYAEGKSTPAFAPLLQALSMAVVRALDLLYDPAAGADTLRTALGPQLPLLVNAGFDVPDLAIAEVSFRSTIPLSGESSVRIFDGIARTMRWLNGFGVPVVLFVDDWQRAPRQARAFAALFVRKTGNCSVLLVERSEASQMPTAQRVACEAVDVGPLSHEAQVQLLGQALKNEAAGAAVVDWLGPAATGLPFDLLEAAREISAREALRLNAGRWWVDPLSVATIDRHDFVDSVVRRSLPVAAAETRIAVAIALWGDEAPLDMIALALDMPFARVMTAAEQLRDRGVLTMAGAVARFAHDRLRAGLLEAHRADFRAEVAAAMAERLRTMPQGVGAVVSRAALSMRLLGGIDAASAALWRERFAEGARDARTIADGPAARDFAEAAWQLDQREPAQDPAAKKLIAQEAVLSAAARRDADALEVRAKDMLRAARTPDELSEAYEVSVVAARLSGDADRAWRWAIEGLARLGVRMPEQVTFPVLAASTIRWRLSLARRQLLPRAARKDASDYLSRIANIAAVVAFERDPLQAVLLAMRLSLRASRLGFHSALWVSLDSFLCAVTGNFDRAAKFGRLAYETRGKDGLLQASMLYRALYFGMIWAEPIANMRATCQEVYDTALAEGDVTYAGFTVRNVALLAWRAEPTLADVDASLIETLARATDLRDRATLVGIQIFQALVRTLRTPGTFAGPDTLAATELREMDPGIEAPAVWIEYLSLRRDWAGILQLAKKMKGRIQAMNTHPGGVVWRMHVNLARLKLGKAPVAADLRFMRRAEVLNPTDHRQKVLLLEAEQHRQRGRKERALAAYAQAMEFATAGSSKLEAGLIATCAAEAAREFGEMGWAERYNAQARTIWTSWGAAALVRTPDAAVAGGASDTELRAASAEARSVAALRSDRAKSRLLAEVGHELRTPLQGMQGLLELAESDPSAINLTAMKDLVGGLRTVVDDLTDLGALGGNAPLKLKPTNIVALLQSECAAAQESARRKGLGFSAQLPEASDMALMIDGARVQQVVRNLLGNAVKYVKSGEIALSATIEPVDGGERICIVVADTGPGLNEADMAKLFEPFERSDAASGNEVGLGLGLPLSRRIAERMGGSLTAENRKPHGARFVFSFMAGIAQAPSSTLVPAAPVKILLVEDVALIRRVVATMARQGGHEVTEAGSGDEALQLYTQQAFDLVLMDLGLPDMTGWEVLDSLQRLDTGGRAPRIIVLTASPQPETEERAREYGVALVLQKPVTGEELRAAIGVAVRSGEKTAPVSSTDDFAELQSEARAEIFARSTELLNSEEMPATELMRSAHKLSGLAAQFGETDIADAADALENAYRAGANPSEAKSALRLALSGVTLQQVTPLISTNAR